MSKEIFIIKKLWVDEWENERKNAMGYNPYGYVESEDEAIEFCGKGKVYKSKNDGWPYDHITFEFIYEKLNHISNV